MRYLFAVLLSLFLHTSSIAQTDTTAISIPGQVRSDVPAATTGTAPVDTGLPSGTGTTGTSGVTMAEAEKHNESNRSSIWYVLAAVAVIVVVIRMRKKKR